MRFIENVVKHAREGIVLSWAVPKQPGFSHVNGRTFEWVKEQLRAKCFQHDNSTSSHLRAASTLWWFQKNVNAFRRISSDNCTLNELMV